METIYNKFLTQSISVKKNRLRFLCPENEYIRQFSINFGNNYAPSGIYFFFNESTTGQGGPNFSCDEKELNFERKQICEEYIYPNLKLEIEEDLIFDESVCLLHLRSGDIFSRKNYYCPVVSNYLQNPLSYYNFIISKYEKCICIAEQGNNPVIEELQKNKKVIFCGTSFEKDLSMLLRCKNLITSGVSTFSIAAALISKNIKKIHVTNIFLEEHLNPTMLFGKVEVDMTNIDQKKYIKNGEWLNTDDQRKKMIEYEQKYE